VDCGGVIPPIGQEYKEDFSGDGTVLVPTGEDRPPNLQRFKVIKEEPPPPPPPVLESFTVERFCPTPGKQSDDLKVKVTALNDDGDPFKGAEVMITLEGGPQNGGKTDSDGVFPHTIEGARDFIGKSVTVEVGNLEPETFIITDELLEPCTGRCDVLSGSYDPGTDSITLTVKGAQPGWDAVIRNITLGESSQVCSDVLDSTGNLTCIFKLPEGQWGQFNFDAQVGGQGGPTCRTEVETPFPAKLILFGDCPTHGEDSDDLIFWGQMVDQEGKDFVKTLSATITRPNGEQYPVELVNGKLEIQTFEGGKGFVGQDIRINWSEGGESRLTITKAMFAPCHKSKPTATPTKTPQPGAGVDPFVVVAGTPVPEVAVTISMTPRSGGIHREYLTLLLVPVYYGIRFARRRRR
jgi:hypothetical protein